MHWEYLDIRKMTDAEFENWYVMADDHRRAKTNACRRREDRMRSIAGDHLARVGIARHCCVDPAAILFGRMSDGKPFATGVDVHFNISHSGHYAVCAVSHRPVGIDVEQIRSVRRKLAEKVCTPAELAYIREAPGCGESLTGEAVVRFFQIWTTKEAYFKWTGTGITDLKSVDTLQRIRSGCTAELDGHMVSICE